jgi:tetratricopeptide (TPR) repeat protein
VKYFLLLCLFGLIGTVSMAAPPDPMQYGRAFLAEGDHAAAVKSYAEALRLNPSDPVALNNMGVAKAAAGDAQAALDFFVQASQLAPLREDIKENLANAQAWVKIYTGAATTAASSLTFIPEPPALWTARPSSTEKTKPTRPLTPVCKKRSCK